MPVQQFLDSLPAERRELLQTVRTTILRRLPDGYEEAINWGMICYQVPLARYPDTHNRQPLMYAALAAQKNHCSLYLTCAYIDEQQRARLEQAFAAIGKKPNMGKSCIRFKNLEDMPLDAIGELLGETSVDEFIAQYEQARQNR